MTATILAIGFICFLFGIIVGFGMYRYQTERLRRQLLEWYPSSLSQLHDSERLP